MKTQDDLWQKLREEAQQHAKSEPILASFLHASILNHGSLSCALSYTLASKLDSNTANALTLREVIEAAHKAAPKMVSSAHCDIIAFFERDSACKDYSTPLLFYKGYQALQAHRVSHWLWNAGRLDMALFFQSRISEVFGIDIHPAATLGAGIMLDHGTGIVIGETAQVGNNVSIMQSVTLGGTGKESGDRHPKIADSVLIGAGSKVLGNILVGEGAQIAPGSVVLKPVEPHTLVSGVPAKVTGKPACDKPADSMDHSICAGLQ